MLSRVDALALAAKHVEICSPSVGVKLVVLEGETLERDCGWMFFYQSETFLKTGDVHDCLAGNAPVIVGRFDGSLHVTGTALPPEVYFDNYSRFGNPHRFPSIWDSLKRWFLRRQ